MQTSDVKNKFVANIYIYVYSNRFPSAKKKIILHGVLPGRDFKTSRLYYYYYYYDYYCFCVQRNYFDENRTVFVVDISLPHLSPGRRSVCQHSCGTKNIGYFMLSNKNNQYQLIHTHKHNDLCLTVLTRM